MTYQEDGRTFVRPQTATLTLQNLGVDVLGVNCSLDPRSFAPIVATILDYAQIPVMVQANAGLPQMENGETVYKITPETYVAYTQKLLAQRCGCRRWLLWHNTRIYQAPTLAYISNGKSLSRAKIRYFYHLRTQNARNW
jgi:hypothetical protein